MKTSMLATATVALLSGATLLSVAPLLFGTPAFAEMVAASPGVTLTEAAQAKFNHNASSDEQIGTPGIGSSGIPAPLYSSAGMGPEDGATLSQVAAAKFSNEGYGQGRLTSGGTEATASLAYGVDRDYSQLASSAGLGRDAAAGMSFEEIATAKLNREH